MAKPNFFVIGAPKCGTTSLAYWLDQHPDIFMPHKEVHFFNSDHKRRHNLTFTEYQRLFDGASSGYQAIGEASVWYLYSEKAIPQILEAYPDAKFIVCLRNPVAMVPSLHEEQCYNGNQPVADLGAAWRNALTRRIPVSSYEPSHLDYAAACSLGAQLSRLFQSVDRGRVVSVLLDDVKKNPRAEHLRILDFLSVDDDGREEFPTLNSAKELKSAAAQRMVRTLGSIKRAAGVEKGFGMLTAITQSNTRYRSRTELPDALRQEFCDYFRSDVELLSSLLQRDLSGWIRD